MKNMPKLCAIIEIGTKSIRMGVFQLIKNKITCLDRLVYPVVLGHEIFNFGQVTFSSLGELCAILERYKTACTSYGVTEIRLVSTSVMREAENAPLIADRIRTQNKLCVETLPDSTEKSLIYSEIISRLPAILSGRTVITYVGSGSIGIACYENGFINRAMSVPLGSLKLHDLLSSLGSKTSDHHAMMSEYLHSIFARVNLGDFDTLVITGTEIERIVTLCGITEPSVLPEISAVALRNLYADLRSVTPANIAVRLGIEEESATELAAALSIYTELLNFSGKALCVLAPSVDLESILAEQLLLPGRAEAYQKHVTESALKAAKLIAKKYNCNEVHYTAVASMACEFFDKLKRIHGLEDRYRIILEIAAILHSSGQYVNVRQRTKCSFDLIKNMDIYGMTSQDILFIAFVSAYNEFIIPNQSDENFRGLSDEHQIIISKLVALFRLANALDKSQKTKILIEKIKAEDTELLIKVSANASCDLEKWAFYECADFFREVFGLQPVLQVKSPFIS